MQCCDIVIDKLLCYETGESRTDKSSRSQYVLAAKKQASSKIKLVHEEEARRKAENPFIRPIDRKEIAAVLKEWMSSADRKRLYQQTLSPKKEDQVIKVTHLLLDFLIRNKSRFCFRDHTHHKFMLLHTNITLLFFHICIFFLQPLTMCDIRDFVLLELLITSLGPRGESIVKMRMEDFADFSECPNGAGISIRIREQKTQFHHGFTVSIPDNKVWNLLK